VGAFRCASWTSCLGCKAAFAPPPSLPPPAAFWSDQPAWAVSTVMRATSETSSELGTEPSSDGWSTPPGWPTPPAETAEQENLPPGDTFDGESSETWQTAESSTLGGREAWDSDESLSRRVKGLGISEDLRIGDGRPRTCPCPASGPTESFLGISPTLGAQEIPTLAPQACRLSAGEVGAFMVASATGRSLTHLAGAFTDAFPVPTWTGEGRAAPMRTSGMFRPINSETSPDTYLGQDSEGDTVSSTPAAHQPTITSPVLHPTTGNPVQCAHQAWAGVETAPSGKPAEAASLPMISLVQRGHSNAVTAVVCNSYPGPCLGIQDDQQSYFCELLIPHIDNAVGADTGVAHTCFPWERTVHQETAWIRGTKGPSCSYSAWPSKQHRQATCSKRLRPEPRVKRRGTRQSSRTPCATRLWARLRSTRTFRCRMGSTHPRSLRSEPTGGTPTTPALVTTPVTPTPLQCPRAVMEGCGACFPHQPAPREHAPPGAYHLAIPRHRRGVQIRKVTPPRCLRTRQNHTRRQTQSYTTCGSTGETTR